MTYEKLYFIHLQFMSYLIQHIINNVLITVKRDYNENSSNDFLIDY